MYTIDRIITLKNMQQHVDYRPHLGSHYLATLMNCWNCTFYISNTQQLSKVLRRYTLMMQAPLSSHRYGYSCNDQLCDSSVVGTQAFVSKDQTRNSSC